VSAPLPEGSIDRVSPVPFYFQLSELLEQEIVAGRYEAGIRLPSEPEISQRYGLSRTTVRQALGRLEQEGLIARRRGQGTFVRGGRPRSWLLQSSEGFFQEEVARMGRMVISKVLRAERGPLPRWACDALGLAQGSIGATLERVRSVDGLVAMYNINHLPAALAPTVLSIEDPDQSLYQRLKERDGIEVAGGRRWLEAVRAGDKLAALLEVDQGAPLVFIESVSWDRTLQPFDVYQTWLRTDRMKIDIQVAASPSHGMDFQDADASPGASASI
jgi:GntR family transcriptional regulator